MALKLKLKKGLLHKKEDSKKGDDDKFKQGKQFVSNAAKGHN